MLTGILVIFSRLYCHYEKKWEKEIDRRKWETFDEYEAAREEFGIIGSNLERIPKHKKSKRGQQSRRKHRY